MEFNIEKKVCVVLTGKEENKRLKEIKDVEWIEVRIDEFLRENDEEELIPWIVKIRECTNSKIIGTVRWYKEGGKNPYYIPDKKRIEIFKNIIEYVDFVDIELKSRILKKVVEIAERNRRKVIISYHNFKKTPGKEILKDLIRKAKKEKPDIIKIATLVLSEKHLYNLAEITYFYTRKNHLVVIPMGNNPLLRFIPLFLGSLFTYVSLSRKVAPGQLSYSEFVELTKISHFRNIK